MRPNSPPCLQNSIKDGILTSRTLLINRSCNISHSLRKFHCFLGLRSSLNGLLGMVVQTPQFLVANISALLTVLLNSLGNTCYMNATMQALLAVPELQVALYTPSLQSVNHDSPSSCTPRLFRQDVTDNRYILTLLLLSNILSQQFELIS